MMSNLVLPDVLPYLVAILGLLVIWQYYQMQIIAGRILAVDVFDRSGIRMYLYATPDDDSVCQVCSEPHGTVHLPSQVAKRDFSPTAGSCKRTIPCSGVLVGIYGGWLEARGVLERLRNHRRKWPVQLSPEELRGVLSGQWERSVSAATDRIAVHMLEALCYEKINPDLSIRNYRYVVDQCKEIRHLLFLVPAYLRLTQLLIRTGQGQEAIDTIERFETRFPPNKQGPHFPTEEQRGLMKTKKTQLQKTVPLKISA